MLRHPHLPSPSGHDGRRRLERLAPVHEDVLQQRVAAGVADDGVEHGARGVHGVGGEGPLPLADLGLALHLPVARQLLRGQHLLRAAGVVRVQPRHRVRRPVVVRRQLRERRGQPARRRHERLLLRRGAHRRRGEHRLVVAASRRRLLQPAALLVVDAAQDPVIQPEAVLLARRAVDVGEAVLVHDPVGLLALGRLAGVEDERLLDGQRLGRAHGLVSAGGLPVPSPGGAVGPGPVRVLAVPRGEEVPLLLAVQRHPWELPWVELVEVDLGDDGDGDGQAGAAAAEVVHHQLLVRRVEPEPRWQLQIRTGAAHRVPPC
uniref:Uncharacterized protein n=1 Tax=Zea mays TaxID=4577 RepID=C0P9W3_MAIZE|nr:unknown [Zea mays]